MPQEYEFGLFVEDDEGPVLRECCADLEQAERRCQQLADIEGLPSLIFTLGSYKEIARFTPLSPLTAPSRPVA